MKARLLALLSAAAILAACSGGGGGIGTTIPSGGSQAPQGNELTPLSTFSAVDTATGTLVRIFPTVDVISSLHQTGDRTTQATNNLQYYGGPVQTAPKLYVVFWGSSWNSSTGDPDGVANQLKAFYGVIGGSKWLNTVSQYYQSNGVHVGNSGSIFAGSYVDTSNTPPKRPTQSNMAAEAARAAAHFGDHTSNASYVVAMPHGVKPSGFGTQYCAYHSTTSASGSTISWTNLPYMPDAGASCGAGSVNSPGTLDGATIVSGHEQGETETDPQPNTGWLDSSGAEIGDKCAWVSLEDNPNAGGYPTQPLWSNATSNCVQSY